MQEKANGGQTCVFRPPSNIIIQNPRQGGTNKNMSRKLSATEQYLYTLSASMPNLEFATDRLFS